MERDEQDRNLIIFNDQERGVARLPHSLEAQKLPEALQLVNRLRTNCGATITALALEDVQEIQQVHQAKAQNQFIDRYRQLEIISRDLGLLIDEEMSDTEASQIVDRWLADTPGLELGSLHQE